MHSRRMHTDDATATIRRNLLRERNADLFPFLYGDYVTERHARVCRERGHAEHRVNGVLTGTCPRCGADTAR